MVLPGTTFRRVVDDLPKVDWSAVSEDKKQKSVAKCMELLRQLPQLTAIEGVKKFEGARHFYEKALLEALEALGATVDEETKTDLVLADFLG